MGRSKFFYPIITLVFSIVALGTSLSLYIYWYLEVSEGLRTVVEKFNLDKNQVLEPQSWVVILVLSILVGFILICISIIFIYNQKNLALYRIQHNFINNFTHELKTPVTSLRLFLETFLKHDLAKEDRTKYINYMLLDIDRLSDNVSRILDLAKIENKRYSEDYKIMELVRVVNQFLTSNKHLFHDCHITVQNPSDTHYYYKIDLPLFEMLLMNILTNAIKYNTSQTAIIDIIFEQKRRTLHIRFKDNGIGIEKNEMKKIFNKFYQIGKADDMTAKGSGIGLYMTKTIARIHKGKIKAESKGKDQGSVFTLILPYFEK